MEKEKVRGRLIVLDGGDAVGKATQSRMLVDHINKEFLFDRSPRQAYLMSFPDYRSETGQAIQKHLKKQIYTAAVNPWTAAVFQAPEDSLIFQCLMLANKYEVAHQIRGLLATGWDVVCDRYAMSAMVYGVEDGLDLQWLENIHSSLPKPDLNILLYLPLDVALDRRTQFRDRYESDIPHRERILGRYQSLWDENAGNDPDSWVKVSSLDTVENVFQDILRVYENLK